MGMPHQHRAKASLPTVARRPAKTFEGTLLCGDYAVCQESMANARNAWLN